MISKITGRVVYDGRGLTAIQANVHCIIRDEEKVSAHIEIFIVKVYYDDKKVLQ